MSKFLKFIVNVFLVFAILVACGILIPPLAGVTTTIVDSASMDTNLPLGSITYSTEVAVSELQTGDEVLKENNSSTYAYVIKSGDASTGKYTVVSSTDTSAGEEEITLRNTVSKVAVVVPYIGYVIIAMHSTEGIVMIALMVVLMIILFILSELWKSPSDEEDDEEDTEEVDGEAPEPEQEAASEVESEESAAEETDESTEQSEAVNDGVDGETDSRMPIAEIDFQDDIPELELDIQMPVDHIFLNENEASETVADVSGEPEEEIDRAEEVASEETASEEAAVEEAANEEAANEEAVVEEVETETVAIEETQEEEDSPEETSNNIEETASTDDEFDLADAIFAATEEVEAEEEKRLEEKEHQMAETQVIVQPEEETPTDEAEEMPERFVPVERPTLDELLDQAKKSGEDPKIRKNDVADVTLVDYTDLL